MSKGKIVLWVGIAMNSIAMLFLTFYLLKLPWLAGDEKLLIWSTSAMKLGARELPPSQDFALVNTSYDISLIDKVDDYGFPVGKQVITDREKLARFFEILEKGKHKPKYIICDIHFLDSTQYDQRLGKALSQFDNLIVSSHLDDDGQLEAPVFEHVNRGLSDYVIGSVFDGVYKYQLFFNDSLVLTPLIVHEYLSGQEAKNYSSVVHIGNIWTPNNFIMNYRLLQKDIDDEEVGFNPVNLGELLFLSDSDIQEFTANKIVVLGDFFENDMHETLFEITSGPIILLNAYLSIKNGDTYLNLAFLLIVLLVYGYLSHMVFSRNDFVEQWIRKKFRKERFTSYFAGFMGYLVTLTVLSLITFFVFNIHLNVFFLAVAFYTEDKIVSFYLKRKEKRVTT